ncbi:MAG: T9SS type A sorting domain-containing protein [Candidatus Kapabacteria bacterium]|nr:T9SS type A sorting domain-containing protein [Candidatus Kapabacteria bacterium]
MKKKKLIFVIIVAIILLGSTVNNIAGESYIPADAKTMYDLGKKYLGSMNYSNLKLVKVYASSIKYTDTNLIKVIGVNCDVPSKEWTGKYYYWTYYFLADNIPSDSTISVQVAFDSTNKPVYWTTIYPKHIVQIIDTTSVSDSDWINSDSVSKLPRLQNDPPCYWTWFFQGGYLQVTLKRNPFNFGGPFVWFLRQDIEHMFYYDAKTGAMLVNASTVGVDDEPTPTIQHSITPMPVSDVLQIQTSAILTSVTLYSILGKRVSSWYDVAPNQLLSVSDVPNGSYLIQFISNGRTQTIPVCINH